MSQNQTNENWNVTVNLTAGLAPSGIGQGYLPRGIYQCVTSKVTQDISDKAEYLSFKHVVQQGYPLQEDGSFKNDPKIAGQKREIGKNLMLKIISIQNDPKKVADFEKRKEQDIKACLTTHGHMDREQATAYGGQTGLNPGMFINRSVWVAYDPPPEGAGRNDGPEVRWLDVSTAQKILSGEQAIAWPWDRKTPRGDADQAMGQPGNGQSAAGAMLPPGATLPPGMNAGVPQPNFARPPQQQAAPGQTQFGQAPSAPPQFGAPTGTPTGTQQFGGFQGGAPTNGAPANGAAQTFGGGGFQTGTPQFGGFQQPQS